MKYFFAILLLSTTSFSMEDFRWVVNSKGYIEKQVLHSTKVLYQLKVPNEWIFLVRVSYPQIDVVKKGDQFELCFPNNQGLLLVESFNQLRFLKETQCESHLN